MKVALVCDWLTNVGGAEKVLLEFHKLFPEAPIYTSKYDKKGIDWFNDADIRTGWLQIFPTKLRRFIGVFRQSYFNHLDLSDYDLIISMTGAEAKSVKKGNATHICYCHVPTQYYWGMYDDYVKNPGFGFLNPIVRFFFRLLVKPLKKTDYRAAQKPDYFLTISEYAKKQIETYYHREATIIHPPVEIDSFKKQGKTNIENFYITTSRQVNWKRIDLAIKACLKTNQQLLIIGDGPEHDDLVKIVKDSPLIKFLPVMNREELKTYLAKAKGYLFPSLEPFGIAPVEALAAGCPVIALNNGGSLDYIKNGENGILFEKQTVNSLVSAIEKFEKTKFDRTKISASAEQFSVSRFDREVKDFIKGKVK